MPYGVDAVIWSNGVGSIMRGTVVAGDVLVAFETEFCCVICRISRKKKTAQLMRKTTITKIAIDPATMIRYSLDFPRT